MNKFELTKTPELNDDRRWRLEQEAKERQGVCTAGL